MRQLRNLCGATGIVACLLNAACSSLPGSNGNIVAQRLSMAEQLEQQGHLAEAYLQWKVLASMAPERADVSEAVARTAERIQVRKAELQKRLKRAQQRNNHGKVQRLHLQLLALEPNNQESFFAARKIEQQVMSKALAEKVYAFNSYRKPKAPSKNIDDKAKQAKADALASEKAGYLSSMQDRIQEKDYLGAKLIGEAYLSKHDAEPKISKLLYDTYSALGDEQQAKGQLESALAYYQQAVSIGIAESAAQSNKRVGLQRQLSNQYLREGMRYFRSDLQKAMSLFEASLSFDPDNHRAQQELDKAARIERNLRRINGNTAR